MSKPETGGSAFPIVPPIDSDGRTPTGYPFPDSGMTLRQWYAGNALVGLVVAAELDAQEDVAARYVNTREGLAKRAFAFADAMIAEGSK